MTDVLERGDVTPSPDEVRRIVEPLPAFDLVVGARVFIAVLSGSAGAIHLVMVPSHWGESVAEGLGFAITGWLQLAFAALVLTRPSRLLLWASAAVNAAAIGAWIVSRTAGLPFGAHSGHAESAGFVDVTCVVFEAVLVVACVAFAFAPRAGARHVRSGLVVAGVASLGVLSLTTAALASPGARNHAAHSHGDEAAAAGHTHGGAAADGHSHETPADDKGFSLLHNGQHDHNMALHTLDAPTQAELDRQIDITREVARQMPTVAAATAKGYSRVGPYFPGIGAHFMREYTPLTTVPDGVMDDVDLRNPFMLIFDGTDRAARLTGFMYYSVSPVEPAGFVGRNDTWHYHESICFSGSPGRGIEVPYGLDHSATPAQCEKVGGRLLPKTGYMAHVWSVPGFEMTDEYGGVFGEANPKLACADGSYYMLPLDEWASHPRNVCQVQ